MSRFERLCLVALLWVTALALAALAIPGLVVIGFFLLIVPGLILFISPAIALYGWLFAAPYAGLRMLRTPWWGAAPLALSVPFLVGFWLPEQSNAVTRANLAAAVASDVRPARPLPIGDTVSLLRDEHTGGWHRGDDGCDDLCLRLLYNGDSKVVYLGQIGRPGLAFTVERRPVCPPFHLSQDVLKWHGWPVRATGRKGIEWPPPPGLDDVVGARIAGGECLVRVGGAIRPDWIIKRVALTPAKVEDRWSLAPQKARGERITIYRRGGSRMGPVGRFTNAHANPLSVPLMPNLMGGIENSRWTWSHTTHGDSRWDWDSVSALRRLVAFKVDPPEGTSPGRMRGLLAAALADPRRASDDAGLILANSVMLDIARNGAKAGDAALLAKVIADDRFTRIEPRYEIAKSLGSAYATVVDSAIARLGRLPASDPTRFPHHALNTLIAQMPRVWFASPPSSLTTILRDPVIAARAEGVISKLDAGGAAAVPLLTEIVTRGAERVSRIEDKGYRRSDVSAGINAAAATLCRIGPPARSSLAPIIAAKQMLIDTAERWPDRNPGRFSALWRGQKVNDGFVVALVSLGVPITNFRAPDEPSSTVNGSWQAMIMLSVKQHDCRL